ncbi:MAG TPA: hypothetical protein VKP67_23250 [Xanthobacteraceae bacterium]|nr:hypothetical protein [Xanthobacteraceae bacterium]
MGVRIIADENYAALYCSTTMFAFGPVMTDYEEAEGFLEWLPSDARSYSEPELELKLGEYREYAEQKAALEKKRDRFLCHVSGPVWDILTSAFEEDDHESGTFNAAGFANFCPEHTPEEIAEAWELYQRYHGTP